MTPTSYEPVVKEGRCGWLAVSKNKRLGIGVVGDTREEALERYEAAAERQRLLLAEPAGDTR